MEDWESDIIVEKWLQENDDTSMPLPNIESKPHLLISKVRKHYMEYLIKLLSVNYESHQRLRNKNIYLPSAIWRCAKIIEMSAAQASMVVQLYRESITSVIKDLKNNTKKGLLFRKLYECLHYSPENEKKTQVSHTNFNDCKCQCNCNEKKKIKNISKSPNNKDTNLSNNITIQNDKNDLSLITNPVDLISQIEMDMSQNAAIITSSPQIKDQISVELQNSDDLMQQLEKLFQGDPNDDDLFDGALCSADLSKVKNKESLKVINDDLRSTTNPQEKIIESKDLPNKCLDERLSLLSGILVNNDCTSQDSTSIQNKKKRPSKWLCEEYFQKVKLFELLDQISDCDRNKLARIKEMLLDLFGEDSDDEDVVSPLEESTEFVISCKERITPWVVKILTPYYVKGRIRGKSLFKSLAKHLIKLIYQCSKYPYEYEVQSFVKDFLNTHKMIRCEADFREFRIENV
ncbi:unnamed protein product, partial [Brenthis ino]